MTKSLMKGLIEKKLAVKKGMNVSGSVCIHFTSPAIQDIILTNTDTVDVFGRIGMTSKDIETSNLEALYLAGHIQIA
jgi:hypothetical protein